MHKITIFVTGALGVFVPQAAHAATARNLTDLINIFIDILQALVPLIVGLAVVVFFWGILKYVIAGGDKDGKAEGRRVIVYGILGIAVMVSVWGLVEIVKNTFFADSPSSIDSGSGGGGGGGW